MHATSRTTSKRRSSSRVRRRGHAWRPPAARRSERARRPRRGRAPPAPARRRGAASGSTGRRVGEVRVPKMLVGSGCSSGFFGALFGVGGGIVIVPSALPVRSGLRPARGRPRRRWRRSSSRRSPGSVTYALPRRREAGCGRARRHPGDGRRALRDSAAAAHPGCSGSAYRFALLLAAVGVRLVV